MSNYDEEFLDMYNDAFNDQEEEAEEAFQEEETEEASQEEEAEEALQEEETEEPSLQEFVRMALRSQEETTPMTVEIDNFDTWDTPLNNCSALTVSALIIFFFLALALFPLVILKPFEQILVN